MVYDVAGVSVGGGDMAPSAVLTSDFHGCAHQGLADLFGGGEGCALIDATDSLTSPHEYEGPSAVLLSGDCC